ncbi:MAG: zinc-binding alcohol dehydrogenase [Gemmiger sp.]|nr:zinc-binding alcohol dehydrogenase [Gemmiger sp.]
MNTTKIEAYEVGHVALKELPLPEMSEQDLYLQTLYSTISPGTELAWLNHMENTPGVYPYYPGYSACCRVLQKGAQVEGFSVGQLVVANVPHGTHSVLPAEKCTPLPAEVDPVEASVFRLASISLQGVRKADIQIGDDVAVLGLGAIGNYAAQIAHVAGSGAVTGFDFVPWRRALAAECGIAQLAENGDAEEYENKFDVVLEATGVPAAINTALHMVKPLGKVILLGSTRGLTDGVNFYRDVHRKGITIVGAHEMHRAQDSRDRFSHFRSNQQDEETIIRLLAANRITLKPLISTTVSPRDAQSIYDRLLAKKEQLLLATFDWSK